ncbi:hypothetical protein, conserved in T. vivax [Trypanosoma vivax Y486]|uniref:Variant surface glycoprotein (VSG) n=1 Tax=Trypanosoma vivax (strain Y486) TaxID=1055687 RepID=F9WMP4_TRYVY|nr:hypothetical protein, conserved in T. vivax [Trypanosoma vivax Y486]|eukprot:CCD18804.1 hypothetical protein, conserved in T. vivax [Trypanosoma vivax Y486]
MLGITVMLVLAVRLFSLAEAASADKGALKVAEAKKICDASGALKVVARHAAEVRKTTCGQAVDLVLSSDDHAAATQAVALAAHTASEAARENATPETLSAAKFLAGLATAARHAARARATADTVEVLAEQLATRMDSMLEVFEKYTHSGGGSSNHPHCLGTGTNGNHKKTIDTEENLRGCRRDDKWEDAIAAGNAVTGSTPGQKLAKALEDLEAWKTAKDDVFAQSGQAVYCTLTRKADSGDAITNVGYPTTGGITWSGLFTISGSTPKIKFEGANGNAANANFTRLQQLVTQLDAEKEKACKACSLDTRVFGNTNTGRTICGGAGTATHETAAQEITKLHDAIQKRLQESRRANDQTTQTEKEKHTTTRNSQHLPDKGTKLSEREREEGAQKRDTTASATSTQDTTRRRAPIGTAACLHLVVAWTHSQRERNKQ